MSSAGLWFDPQLRDLVRLVLFAALISLLAVYGFRRNAPARRAFVIYGAALLLALPLLLSSWPLLLPVGVHSAQPLTLGLSMPKVLLAVWWLPALALVTRTLVANRRARRRLLSLPNVEDPVAQRTALQIAQSLGCRHRPQLKVGPSACCVTTPQPLILLPSALLQRSQDSEQPSAALRAVLTHELVHASRYDDRWLLFLQLVLDWYWWMPWLKTLARRFEAAIEESCDDRAADLFSPGHDYLSGVLAATTETGSPTRDPYAAYMSAHPLVGRVLRFGRRRDQDADWPQVGGTALLALLGLLLITGIEPVPIERTPRHLVLSPIAPVPVTAPAMEHVHQVRSTHPYVSKPELFSALRAHRLCEEALPIYPGMALLQGLEGEVEVRYVIGQDGRVVSATVVDDQPRSVFAEAALAAVKRNRYPALHQLPRPAPSQLIDPHETGPPLQVRQRFSFRLAGSI